MHTRMVVIIAIAGALALAGCGSSDEDEPVGDAGAAPTGTAPAEPQPTTQPTRLTLTATDYAFEMPAEIEAGLVTFQMPNQGAEIHHAQLVRLNEGGDLDAALAALAEEDLETVFRHGSPAGGVGIVAPGQTGAATVNLAPGQYAFICGIPSPDGVPHFQKGMVSRFSVTGEAPAGTPQVDTVGEVTLSDFAFGLPENLDGTVAVTNAGEQPHEMLLFQLGEGVTLEEALASLEGPPPADGPPPAIPAGGMQALMPGDTGYLDLSALAPGTYGLVCFIPDPETGKAHLELGMVNQIQIG